MYYLDLSLNNKTLYGGCEVEEVAGRLNLKTPPEDAIRIVGRTLDRMLSAVDDRNAVTLTGAMAVWVYLIAFHATVHRFNRVYYHDGRNLPVLIAAHG